MKINLLYLLIPAALAGCYFIIRDLQGQSVYSFFGTAETEPVTISNDYDGRVAKLNVKIGSEVNAGDTLLIMHRTEIARNSFLLSSDINATATELNAHTTRLRNELDVLESDYQQKITGIEDELRQLRLQDSIEQTVRTALLPGIQSTNPEIRERVQALQQRIKQEQSMYQRERKLLADQISAQNAIARAKTTELRGKQDWQADDTKSLYLIAPISGYVDQLSVSQGSKVQAYKDLLRIYPTRTAKVIGFIHESAAMPFHIGDSVSLSSVTRPQLQYRGQIIAASPKLVELPLRLRKFIEVRAWGREVIIQIPQGNDFYIGEKLNITLDQPAK